MPAKQTNCAAGGQWYSNTMRPESGLPTHKLLSCCVCLQWTARPKARWLLHKSEACGQIDYCLQTWFCSKSPAIIKHMRLQPTGQVIHLFQNNKHDKPSIEPPAILITWWQICKDVQPCWWRQAMFLHKPGVTGQQKSARHKLGTFQIMGIYEPRMSWSLVTGHAVRACVPRFACTRQYRSCVTLTVWQFAAVLGSCQGVHIEELLGDIGCEPTLAQIRLRITIHKPYQPPKKHSLLILSNGPLTGQCWSTVYALQSL